MVFILPLVPVFLLTGIDMGVIAAPIQVPSAVTYPFARDIDGAKNWTGPVFQVRTVTEGHIVSSAKTGAGTVSSKPPTTPIPLLTPQQHQLIKQLLSLLMPAHQPSVAPAKVKTAVPALHKRADPPQTPIEAGGKYYTNSNVEEGSSDGHALLATQAHAFAVAATTLWTEKGTEKTITEGGVAFRPDFDGAYAQMPVTALRPIVQRLVTWAAGEGHHNIGFELMVWNPSPAPQGTWVELGTMVIMGQP